MNRFATAVLLVAGIGLTTTWLWHEKPVLKAAPGPGSLAEKLNTIIIPEYLTAGLTLEAAVEYLRVKSRQHDSSTSETGVKGVNIVIIAGGEMELPAASGLLLRDVPLGEALRHITGLLNLKYSVEPHAVAIRERQDVRGPGDLKKSVLQQHLKKRIRPTVNFQDASLEEAVEYLRISQGCRDVTDAQVIDVPLNFVLHLREGIKRPPVSLHLNDIPMSEALRYCAEISRARLRYDTSAVVITDFETDVSAPDDPADSPILPVVELQDATLDESLDFVRLKSRELNPDHRETPITVTPGAAGRSITLSLKSISVHDALRYIAELSGRSLSIENGGYVLSPL